MVYDLVELLTRLGYTLSLKKCHLQPSTSVRFLGFLVDSIKQAYFLPSDKKDKFITLREFLLSLDKVDVCTLQRFAGKCISMFLVVPAAKLCSREINNAISYCIKNSKNINLEGNLRKEIEYWRFIDTWEGFSRWRSEYHKQIVIATDASLYRYGVVVLSGVQKDLSFW